MLNLSQQPVDSAEVMVRLYIDADDSIQDVTAFIYQLDPDTRKRINDDEWVRCHIQEGYSGADLRAEVGIAEPGVYQVLFKAVVHGRWSGWESPEYDEELEIREPQILKMPDDWFNFTLRLDSEKEEPDHVE